MDPVETYIRDLLDIHRSGQAVKETSSYGVLANLFNAIGKTLKPKVQCIINLKNRGAGIPDGGLFTPDQLQRVSEDQRFISQVPARGVIEIKSTGDDVQKIAASEQVLRYLGRYGQVLVTNYRDFLLVGRGADGNPVHLGRALTVDEAREVTSMVRRIAAIVLLEPALDTNYQAIKHVAYAWPL